MPETAIDLVAQAIHDILMATDQFKTGSPHIRKDIGPKPAFSVFWTGWDDAAEASPVRQPSTVTHELQLDIYATLDGGAMGESERKFRLLIQESVKALKGVPRLNGTCIRFRIPKGVNDIDTDGNNPFLVCTMKIEVDRPTW